MAFTPRNPFTQSELENNEAVFSVRLLNQASHLAEKYIEARQERWSECAERIDLDIGAFLSEEFDLQDDKLLFQSRFLTLYADCNAAFGSLNHGHCLWAFKNDYF
ncbi:hypothetical protein [Enterobacter kobei]|uniref:hypothetical protein n=1 Tax=Enterobacter kobei TaxID=208224 RepID=UPI003AAD3CDC